MGDSLNILQIDWKFSNVKENLLKDFVKNYFSKSAW